MQANKDESPFRSCASRARTTISSGLLLLLVIVHARTSACSGRRRELSGEGATTPVLAGEQQPSPWDQEDATGGNLGSVWDEVEEGADDNTFRDGSRGHLSRLARNLTAEETEDRRQCSMRREWQSPCKLWSHDPHHRYLLYGPLRPFEGVGGNLLRIAWAFNRAISFDLELVFKEPLKAGHGVETLGPWLGITNNSLLAIRDSTEFSRAAQVDVPTWEIDDGLARKFWFPVNWYDPAGESQWFNDRIKENSVVYVPDTMSLNKYRFWGRAADPRPADRGICSHASYALQQVFWNGPYKRDRCRSVLSGIEIIADMEKDGKKSLASRPWFIAVHIRRGDKVKSDGNGYAVPLIFHKSAMQAVLRGVSKATPGGKVYIAVFSEGKVISKSEGGTGELQLVDDFGKPMDFDVPRDFCGQFGLRCIQELALDTPALESLECLATADILMADNSQFSEGAAALSTNVKIVHLPSDQDQYSVTINKSKVITQGHVSKEKQKEIKEAISNWYDCYREARLLSDRSATGDGRVYQTIDN